MSDEPSGECPPEWRDYYEARLNNSSNEFLTRLQHANAELAALRATIAELRDVLWGATVLAESCGAPKDNPIITEARRALKEVAP